MKIKLYQSGVSLIEVLIALLVLGIGITAIAQLQGSFFLSGSSSQAKNVAMQLAQEKIDDLRGFTQIVPDDTSPSSLVPVAWTSASTAMSYNYIQGATSQAQLDSGGGSSPYNASCSAVPCGGSISANTTVIGNTEYTLTWDATDYFIIGGAISTTIPIPYPSAPHYKEVRVNVSWTDTEGVAQQAQLQSFIGAVDVYGAGLIAGGLHDPEGPSVAYTPGLAPEVLKTLVTSDDTYKESTKALPDVSLHGDYNVVSFDDVTFKDHGGTFSQEKVDEFVTLTCKCTLESTAADAFLPAHVTWNTTTNSMQDTLDSVVSKTVGTAINDPNNIPDLCNVCCRDHHDKSGETTLYGPSLITSGTHVGDHVHYKVQSGASSAIPSSVVASSGDTYREACRMKRINGSLRVFQDWPLKTLTIMPEVFLNANTTTQTNYVNYITSYVIYTVSNSFYGGTEPAKPSGRAFSLQQGGSQQVLSRAIFIDEMSSTHITQVNSIINDLQTEISNGNTSVFITDALAYIPFVEQNITKLINWKIKGSGSDVIEPTCADPTIPSASSACVASADIVDETATQNNYERGLVLTGASATGSFDVFAFTTDDNTVVSGQNMDNTGTIIKGLVKPFTPVFTAGTSTNWDSISWITTSSSTTESFTILYDKGSNFPNGNPWNNLTISPTVGSCTTPSGTGSASRSITCTVPQSSSVTVTASFPTGTCTSGADSVATTVSSSIVSTTVSMCP